MCVGRCMYSRNHREKKLMKKKVRFLGIMGPKNGVCVGRCMCSRYHGGKKVICKK